MTTRAQEIAAAAARLAEAGVPDAGRDARLLCRWAAGLSGAALSAALGETPTGAECDRFAQAVAARVARVPLSHITGGRAFWGRTFRVSAAVLDPRPETETLIAEALRRPAQRVLDLGTGSGCILLTLLAEWPGATGLGTDISDAALAVARENAVALGVAERASFLRADWFAGAPEGFDLIVSNPPYIAAAEMADLAPEVRLHEPAMALTPGGDGLDAYRLIAAGVGAHLAPRGRLLLEIGPTQGAAVAALLTAAGLEVAPPLRDIDGRQRVLAAVAARKTASNTH
jgi:release factor glutamine methyltransferase